MADVQPARSELDLRDYVGVVRRQKWPIFAITLAVVLLAIGVSLVQTPIYEAEANLIIEVPAASLAVAAPGSEQGVSQEQVQTEAELMGSGPIKRRIAEQLGYVPDVDIATIEGSPAIAITGRLPMRSTAWPHCPSTRNCATSGAIKSMI